LRPHCNGLRLNRAGEPPKIETKFRPSYEDSADGGRQSAYKFCTSRGWKLRRSNRNGFEVDARHSPIAPSKGEGWQLGVAGTIFSQFNLDAPSKDLINTDFRIGIPLSYKRGPFSARASIYHQSSHLGDEFILSGAAPRCVNLSFEALNFVAAWELGGWRPYAGGFYLLHRRVAREHMPRHLAPGEITLLGMRGP